MDKIEELLKTDNVLTSYIYEIENLFIKTIVNKALIKYGSLEQIKYAKEIAKWTLYITSKKSDVYGPYKDGIITAAYLHNLFYSSKKDKDYTLLFKARQEITELAKKLNLYDKPGVREILELSFQTIEAQLGKDHPIKLLIPNINSPSFDFSLAINIYNDMVSNN